MVVSVVKGIKKSKKRNAWQAKSIYKVKKYFSKSKRFQFVLGIVIGIMFISANLAYFFILKEKSTWFINNVINQFLTSLLFDTQVYFNVKKEQ